MLVRAVAVFARSRQVVRLLGIPSIAPALIGVLRVVVIGQAGQRAVIGHAPAAARPRRPQTIPTQIRRRRGRPGRGQAGHGHLRPLARRAVVGVPAGFIEPEIELIPVRIQLGRDPALAGIGLEEIKIIRDRGHRSHIPTQPE